MYIYIVQARQKKYKKIKVKRPVKVKKNLIHLQTIFYFYQGEATVRVG